jgi:cytochrome c2
MEQKRIQWVHVCTDGKAVWFRSRNTRRYSLKYAITETAKHSIPAGSGRIEAYAMKRLIPILLISSFTVRAADYLADSVRGRQVFETLSCSKCHSVNGKGGSVAPDLGRIVDRGFTPASLAAMWNHAATMLAEMQLKHQAWPALTARELTDILVYLRNQPFPLAKPPAFQIGDADGEAVFRARGCQGCHHSVADLSAGTHGPTLTEFAAAMWNHEPILSKAGATPTRFTPEEMRDLLGYLWAQQFFVDGPPRRGGEYLYPNDVRPVITRPRGKRRSCLEGDSTARRWCLRFGVTGPPC